MMIMYREKRVKWITWIWVRKVGEENSEREEAKGEKDGWLWCWGGATTILAMVESGGGGGVCNCYLLMLWCWTELKCFDFLVMIRQGPLSTSFPYQPNPLIIFPTPYYILSFLNFIVQVSFFSAQQSWDSFAKNHGPLIC